MVLQEAFQTAIEMAGFEATIVSSDARVSGDQIVLQIEGMSCSSCSTAVEKALQAIHGVQSASVNLLAGKAEVDSHILYSDLITQCI